MVQKARPSPSGCDSNETSGATEETTHCNIPLPAALRKEIDTCYSWRECRLNADNRVWDEHVASSDEAGLSAE
jgi:hypothetical protein